MSFFSDPEAATRYAEGPVRQVPGFRDLQKMATILLAENAGADAKLLVVGAGGGLELKVFAKAQPGWRFCAVDPSAPMLDQARVVLGPLAGQVDFHVGVTETAPAGPFDGASCLLVMHFLTRSERLSTLQAIHQRLKPGAPLVMVHHNVSAAGADTWLGRSVTFAHPGGLAKADVHKPVAMMKAKLTLLSPDEEVALLHEAGFTDVELFYAAFSFKGWVAIRP